MSNKLIFADTITEIDLGAMASSVMSDCEKFGMTWGCRSDCPVFQRGKCKDVFFENIETFTKGGDFDEDNFIEILSKYENRLTNEEISYLFVVAQHNTQI
jgi:hypothetical protein